MPVNPPLKVTKRDKLAIAFGRHAELVIFYVGLITGIGVTATLFTLAALTLR